MEGFPAVEEKDVDEKMDDREEGARGSSEHEESEGTSLEMGSAMRVFSADEKKCKVQEAKRRNSCRGCFEGRYEEICKVYARCDACWADFGGE